jgi:hypothetical protein
MFLVDVLQTLLWLLIQVFAGGHWCALNEDKMLEDNDLKLLEENTGETFAWQE